MSHETKTSETTSPLWKRCRFKRSGPVMWRGANSWKARRDELRPDRNPNRPDRAGAHHATRQVLGQRGLHDRPRRTLLPVPHDGRKRLVLREALEHRTHAHLSRREWANEGGFGQLRIFQNARLARTSA